jgi:hypothetical protein
LAVGVLCSGKGALCVKDLIQGFRVARVQALAGPSCFAMMAGGRLQCRGMWQPLARNGCAYGHVLCSVTWKVCVTWLQWWHLLLQRCCEQHGPVRACEVPLQKAGRAPSLTPKHDRAQPACSSSIYVKLRYRRCIYAAPQKALRYACSRLWPPTRQVGCFAGSEETSRPPAVQL